MSGAGGNSVEATPGSGCERLHEALCECHRRIPPGRGRNSACRHLNRALAECLVSKACPHESEAVRSFCASGGTALKRGQCREARLSLSVCLSAHQQEMLEEFPVYCQRLDHASAKRLKEEQLRTGGG